MALTKQQELALFEILEVPYSTTVGILQPDNNLTSIEFQADNLAYQAFAKIQSRLTVIAADTDLENVLIEYLDLWISMGTNVTTMDGGFEGANGISDDPDRERRVIRGRVLVIVPMYRCHEELQGTMARNLGAPIIR